MTALRRTGTILGWSAGVCGVVYVVWVAYFYVATDGLDPANAWSDSADTDVTFMALFWTLVASPVIGGVIGLVRAVRGARTRDKVVWSLLGIVLMAVAWYALAALAILGLNLLDLLD
jgi:hypothetical protein